MAVPRMLQAPSQQQYVMGVVCANVDCFLSGQKQELEWLQNDLRLALIFAAWMEERHFFTLSLQVLTR